MALSALAMVLPGKPGCRMEDSQIVGEFLETQDPGLFELLVDRYKNRVFRLVLSILGSSCAAEAEEVTQEVFINAYRNLASFRAEYRFGTWLYRIAYNRAIDEKRKARFSRAHVTEDALMSVPAGTTESSPLAQTELRERQRVIGSCLEELPDLYRSVVHLHYWMEYSMEEIGELHGIPVGTVKSYLYRARQLLSPIMKKKGIDHVWRLP
jgi:RNA polymerase sigma-70 factor (ECF subfamily)